MAKRPILAAVLIATLALAGCRSAAVNNVVDAPFPVGVSGARSLSVDQTEAIIVKVGSDRGWIFTKLGTGHLEGTVNVRGKHTAVIDVLFDREVYSILYKDSQNLNYDAAENVIHPNYNSWVGLLDNDIKLAVQAAKAS
ncbi:MAG: hypothetical protein AAGG06_03270 [Pseudomonadota bacterium]